MIIVSSKLRRVQQSNFDGFENYNESECLEFCHQKTQTANF